MKNLTWIIPAVAALTTSSVQTVESADLPLLLKESFDEGADRWKPTDTRAWRVEKDDENPIYRLFRQSNYKPPHRSPINITLFEDENLGDFTLTTKVRSTSRDYPHRSMCMFFGFQDPAHFYYVHFGKVMDDHANQIFIVNDAPRIKISTKTTDGTPWDDEWHAVKITRQVESGDIAIYFDDMKKPVMTANDRTFTWGRIGLGSFDDIGDFDDVVLRGEKVEQTSGK